MFSRCVMLMMHQPTVNILMCSGPFHFMFFTHQSVLSGPNAACRRLKESAFKTINIL